MAAQREAQERAHAQLRELITGLSVQVMQLSNKKHENLTPGGNNLSTLFRIDFPKFEGEDAQGWFYKCAEFFELDDIMKNRKVKVASIHLSGKALVWHQSYMKGVAAGTWPPWEGYKVAILSRFGMGPFDDPLADLVKLKQEGSVAQCQEKFDTLINRVDLSGTQYISCFLSGLSEELQCAVSRASKNPSDQITRICPTRKKLGTVTKFLSEFKSGSGLGLSIRVRVVRIFE